jgi:hypothetical protein
MAYVGLKYVFYVRLFPTLNYRSFSHPKIKTGCIGCVWIFNMYLIFFFLIFVTKKIVKISVQYLLIII